VTDGECYDLGDDIDDIECDLDKDSVMTVLSSDKRSNESVDDDTHFTWDYHKHSWNKLFLGKNIQIL
jgi:hypothetical protein